MMPGPDRRRGVLDALAASKERDRATQRQIAAAQGTPQVVAGASGIGAYVPGSNGQPGSFQAVQTAPDKVMGADDQVDNETGMKLSDIYKSYARAKFGQKDDQLYRLMIGQAKTPEERARIEQQFGPDQAQEVFWAARLRAMGRDPNAIGQGGQAGGAGQGGGAVGAGQAGGQAVGQSGGGAVKPTGGGISRWARK